MFIFSVYQSQLKPDNYYNPRGLTSPSSPPPLEPLSPGNCGDSQHSGSLGFKPLDGSSVSSSSQGGHLNQNSEHAKGKRGRPRKHAIKIPLPPLYVFIRNLLHNRHYNPRVITWVSCLLFYLIAPYVYIEHFGPRWGAPK